MSEFPLRIVTADGLVFDGPAERLVVRTTEGDVGILKNHIDYLANLVVGELRLTTAQGRESAAVSAGFVSVLAGKVTVVASTCEWAKDIDLERAKKAKERAEELLKIHKSGKEMEQAENKLMRALNRIKISSDL